MKALVKLKSGAAVQAEFIPPEDIGDSGWQQIWLKSAVARWLHLATRCCKEASLEIDLPVPKWGTEDFIQAASAMPDAISQCFVKEAKFHRPENYDKVKEHSTNDRVLWRGCNDWENWDSAVWVEFTHSPMKRVYLRLKKPVDIDEKGKWTGAFGNAVIAKWLRLTREHSKAQTDYEHLDMSPEDFIAAAKQMDDVVAEYGLEQQKWEEKSIKEAAAAPALNATSPQPTEGAAAPVQSAPEGSGLSNPPQVPEIAAGPPRTGPGAIYEALKNIDLDAKEAEAKSILDRKLKSKRDGAVKVLGIIDGLRRTGIKPHELMISRVPVIPPQFRPFTAAGDVFIPGDANELYRDLINMRDVNKQIGETFGPAVMQKHGLQVYDAAKALYGFGEPTSPKTKEREISGFLKKISGSNPKLSFVIRKMLSKPQDYVGRSVVTVNPDYDLNEIGIPHDMAWTLYAPYIQRRLVRGGMKMEEAVRHVRDKSEHADKALDLEMKERPVIYSRSPAWHKFSVVAGWPKRVEGNAIQTNPFIASGMNMDYDGDTANVHVPAFPESVEDAKNKLMPDKMLFSIKKRNEVVPALKQEQILGLHNAQHRPSRKVHQFKNKADALQAVNAGKVPMSDEVEFP